MDKQDYVEIEVGKKECSLCGDGPKTLQDIVYCQDCWETYKTNPKEKISEEHK